MVALEIVLVPLIVNTVTAPLPMISGTAYSGSVILVEKGDKRLKSCGSQ